MTLLDFQLYPLFILTIVQIKQVTMLEYNTNKQIFSRLIWFSFSAHRFLLGLKQSQHLQLFLI